MHGWHLQKSSIYMGQYIKIQPTGCTQNNSPLLMVKRGLLSIGEKVGNLLIFNFDFAFVFSNYFFGNVVWSRVVMAELHGRSSTTA